MKFTLTFECDNAAFDEAPFEEAARILRAASNRVGSDYGAAPAQFARGFLSDLNGNRVGKWEMEP